MVNVNTDMPQPTFPIYSHGVRPFLRLREFLAVAVPPRPGRTPGNRTWPTVRTIIPDPGQFHQARLRPTGVIVRLEHRPDGLFLVIGDDITYKVVPQPMPRLWWHSRSLQPVSPRPLDAGHPLSRQPQPPNRYYVLDSLGNRVLLLYQTADGRICSRHEYEKGGRTLYLSDHVPKSAREQRELHFISALRPVVGNAEPRLAHSLKIFPFLHTFGSGDQYCVFLCRGQGLFDLGRFAQTTTAMARQVEISCAISSSTCFGVRTMIARQSGRRSSLPKECAPSFRLSPMGYYLAAAWWYHLARK